jgi:hypothetical protein
VAISKNLPIYEEGGTARQLLFNIFTIPFFERSVKAGCGLLLHIYGIRLSCTALLELGVFSFDFAWFCAVGRTWEDSPSTSPDFGYRIHIVPPILPPVAVTG